MAVTLVAKGSRDRDPRVLEVRRGTGMGGFLKNQSLGSTFRLQWGPLQPPELSPRRLSQLLYPLHNWP